MRGAALQCRRASRCQNAQETQSVIVAEGRRTDVTGRDRRDDSRGGIGLLNTERRLRRGRTGIDVGDTQRVGLVIDAWVAAVGFAAVAGRERRRPRGEQACRSGECRTSPADRNQDAQRRSPCLGIGIRRKDRFVIRVPGAEAASGFTRSPLCDLKYTALNVAGTCQRRRRAQSILWDSFKTPK